MCGTAPHIKKAPLYLLISQETPDLIVTSDKKGIAVGLVTPDDNADFAFHARFIERPAQLFVKKTWFDFPRFVNPAIGFVIERKGA